MNKQLSETARQMRNEYHRKWRKNNPHKVAKYNASYWERQASNLDKVGAES